MTMRHRLDEHGGSDLAGGAAACPLCGWEDALPRLDRKAEPVLLPPSAQCAARRGSAAAGAADLKRLNR
jgi:hypothetical protein